MATKALLIVHGIGEQRRGETSEKLVRGLHAALGADLEVLRRGDGSAAGVRANGVEVGLYEVYWADLLDREANRGALGPATLPTVVWHPVLSRRAGLLDPREYPVWLVGAWLAALLPASLLAYPLVLGARPFAQVFDRRFGERLRTSTRGLSLGASALAHADATAHGETIVEEVLEGVVADIPNYMRSAARGEGVALDVLARFHEAMRAARDACGEVHVLAHSLGTVVAYHALTGFGDRGASQYTPRRLYTIGSPLEKIRFFWPWTIREAAPSSHPEFRWTNFYHAMDGVSGRLRRFERWAPLDNVRLEGGGGMLRSHVVYEQSPQFLGTLTEELFGARRAPRLTRAERLRDRVLTACENLAGPAALLACLVLGLALVAVVLLLGPYLLSLPLRWIGADEWTSWAGTGLTMLLLTAMSIELVRKLRACYRAASTEVRRAAAHAGSRESAVTS